MSPPASEKPLVVHVIDTRPSLRPMCKRLYRASGSFLCSRPADPDATPTTAMSPCCGTPGEHVDVVVAVQNKLGAVLLDDARKLERIFKGTTRRRLPGSGG